MTITLVPILVMLVGLALWFFAKPSPKLQDAGRIMFIVGLVFVVWMNAHPTTATLTLR